MKTQKFIHLNTVKSLLMSSLIALFYSCSPQEEMLLNEQTNAEASLPLSSTLSDAFNSSNFYSSPSGNLPKLTFNGSTSASLNTFIKNASNDGGAVITIPKATYKWNDILLQSNVHLEIEAGTIIQPESNSTRRIFNLGGNSSNNSRIENVSIEGVGGRFTVDISDPAFTNNNLVAFRVGRVDNFKLFSFDIEDRRSSVASICLVYVGNTNETRPWATNGVIQGITQYNAHTGYGLVQCYSAENILFKNIICHGGVTLRLETDDKVMKEEIKFGAKEAGVDQIFASNVRCTNGISPLMFSPHFMKNGSVTVDRVVANGCAFAVRVEQGFVELFDVDYQFSTANNTERDKFKAFIESQFNLSNGQSATSGNPYKRNNGTQWAVRLSAAAINAPRNAYVSNQLGNLMAGEFATSYVSDITANYRNNGAKIKQAHLGYIPCSEWSRLLNPTTSLGMFNGFEYHGPSVALSVDNTNGTSNNGNYIIQLSGQQFSGFPSGHIQNIKNNTGKLCNNNVNSITTYVAEF
ncbi:hypothetical protein [Persicobacter diffluens]|uniref:Right handed beta helix domain-containing protein n=1 Tax=Persicobacter diffluens TaxID=981 RepID=A0AAN5APF7_9BACT|nr:hypothetical protein PEDI_48380 [Persicobacter diffluens]